MRGITSTSGKSVLIMITPEPKCVQWKRRGQARIHKEIAGMTHEEELAYWNKAYKRLVRTHTESKRRLEKKNRDAKSEAALAGSR